MGLPQSTDAQKMGYTNEQIQWVIDNEVYMWQYFVQKQLLYKTDPSLTQRFIDPAPFSKFYLEIDNQSPGRVGYGWVGKSLDLICIVIQIQRLVTC